MYERISDYYSQYYLNRTKFSSLISRAILKHSIESFVLIIIDVNPADLAAAEQKWIDLLSPPYNQQLNVGKVYVHKVGSRTSSFLGQKHTPEAIKLFTEYALARPFPHKPGYEFIVTDNTTGISTSYTSIRKGVEAMGWDQANIMRRFRDNTTKPYKNRYTLVRVKPVMKIK